MLAGLGSATGRPLVLVEGIDCQKVEMPSILNTS